MREIVLDTETTGLDPVAGHRLIEIGCWELMNHLPTGERFHRYINPERDVPPEAQAVHGLTEKFLADKPVFAEIVADLLAFIGPDTKLIIHNAEFDLKFVNHELARLGFPPLEARRAIDTVMLARRKFPGAPASLDALCTRFNIDRSHRVLHGALLDAELLCEVYLELIGGRQSSMELLASGAVAAAAAIAARREMRPPRPHAPTPEELEAHAKMVGGLKGAVWLVA
jgi:DNA polymerase-3 subunit epsilon